MEPVDTCLDLSGAAQQFWSSPDQALFPQMALVALEELRALKATIKPGRPRKTDRGPA